MLFPIGGDPSQWEIEETVRFKDLYDQDRDGKLNREEQLRWVAPNSYGSAREEVCVCGQDSTSAFAKYNSCYDMKPLSKLKLYHKTRVLYTVC